MGSLPHLQGIFPTQESNQGLLHWQADSFLLRHLGSPIWDVLLLKKKIHYLSEIEIELGIMYFIGQS